MTRRWTEAQARAAVRMRDEGITHTARWVCPCGSINELVGPLMDREGRQLRDRGEEQAVSHIALCAGW